MKNEKFIETMLPRIGPSVFQNINTATMASIAELLIRKGIFTREELTSETEVQLGKMADVVMKMPVPSPFQP